MEKYLIHKKYFPRVRATHHDGPVRPWARHQGAEPLAALVVISLAVLRDSGSWNKRENGEKCRKFVYIQLFTIFVEGDDLAVPGSVRRALVDRAAAVDARLPPVSLGSADE